MALTKRIFKALQKILRLLHMKHADRKKRKFKKIKSIALIGFEYRHHVPAFVKSFRTLQKKGINLEPVIWSARNGIEAEIKATFPKCKFLDGEKGWFGEFEKIKNEELAREFSLSELEIKNFSYTYSRTKFFRDPRKVKPKEQVFFTQFTLSAMDELLKQNVDIIFFPKMPHDLIDLAFYFAARRLGLPFLFTDGPFYGNDFVYPIVNSRFIPARSRKRDFFQEFADVMEGRNLNKSLSLPHYQSASLDYLPEVPASRVPFFFTKLERTIYRISYSQLLAKYSGIFVNKALLLVSKFLRYVLFSRKIELKKKKYILLLLHYHPEATTCPTAADTPFEEERAVALAKRFPDLDIVMREHPSNMKFGSYLAYRNPILIKTLLAKYPNLHYVQPGSRSEYRDLLTNSFCTISTCGTVAMESIQLGVPSIHFYHSFAEHFPGVHIVSDVEMLTKEVIYKLTSSLEHLGPDKVVDACYEAARCRHLVTAFLCGYHKYTYSEDDYIDNASEIIVDSLSAVFEAKH